MANEIGKTIRRLRKEKKYTILDMANKIGVREATFQRYESGVIKNIPYDKLTQIAEALEVDATVLLSIEPSEIAETQLVNNDPELTEYLEELKNRPELRMMFSLTKSATKADVEQAVAIVEAFLKAKGNNNE